MTNEQHDTEAHIFIPKNERAGNDTEGHAARSGRGMRAGGLEEADDTEGHMVRSGRIEDASEAIDHDTEGHAIRSGRIEDASEAIDDDTEGHVVRGRG